MRNSRNVGTTLYNIYWDRRKNEVSVMAYDEYQIGKENVDKALKGNSEQILIR